MNTDDTSVFYTPITSGSNYTVLDNLSAQKFGVISIHDPDSSVTNTYGMNSGDRVILVINISAILTGDNGLPATWSTD